jgi:hypothetical protein
MQEHNKRKRALSLMPSGIYFSPVAFNGKECKPSGMQPLLAAAIAGNDFVHGLIYMIVIGIILGLLLWLVSVIPLIPPIVKQVLTWLIYLVAVLVLVNFLLGLTGHPLIAW